MMKAVLISTLASLFAVGTIQAGKSGAKDEVTSTIEQFKLSGDRQDPALAETALHKDFTLFYRGKDGTVITTKEAYITALKNKAIGGAERSMKIREVEISGDVATARVEFQSSTASFEQFINLIREEEGWKIVNIALNFQPKS